MVPGPGSQMQLENGCCSARGCYTAGLPTGSDFQNQAQSDFQKLKPHTRSPASVSRFGAWACVFLESSMVGLLGILGETHCSGGRGDSDFLVALLGF